ncbi:MAG: amidase, partial [Xanthomonadales bacterium]|nr:amidase [Xanthomonadales bacterium]
MTDSQQAELSNERLRGASAFQLLHWMASGRVDSRRLVSIYRDAIGAENAQLNAFVTINEGIADLAAASDARRAAKNVIGRLDGLAVAIKDNIDVAGLPTALGLQG